MPDKIELIGFIHDITYLKDKTKIIRQGKRNMVDMNRMVKDYFYDPRTKGSNSIKAALPAVLSRSKHIQEKYSKPLYGKNSSIKSLNFEDGWIWIQEDEEGNVISPYKLLPSLFEDLSPAEKEDLLTSESLKDDGAAMTAFAKMQFEEMSEVERGCIANGLLKYCELDTLAMVIIYEFWIEELKS